MCCATAVGLVVRELVAAEVAQPRILTSNRLTPHAVANPPRTCRKRIAYRDILRPLSQARAARIQCMNRLLIARPLSAPARVRQSFRSPPAEGGTRGFVIG